MWITTLAGCFFDPYPQAFDWKIDRTIVAAVSVWPIDADWRVPRTIDALVLSPHRVNTVRAEICGLSPDQPVQIWDTACFSEQTLIDVIPGEVPGIWQPAELGFACTGPVLGGYYYGTYSSYDYYHHDSAEDTAAPPPTCGSTVPFRVYASTDEDEASAATQITMYTDPFDPRALVQDPALAHPTLELVEGTVEAGSEVLLRFSVETEYSGNGYAWYADDGLFLGTGRTQAAGMTPNEARTYAQNRLQIPDDYQGSLLVAAVILSSPPLWATTTLEVP